VYYPAITIRETVRYVLGLQGIAGAELVARSESTLDSLGLIPFADAPGYQLSVGLQKATLLAMAMAKQSRILVLDEPTNLIDLVKRNQFWEVS
jgi:ABC-type multidrug transport system ATPase subunit